MGKITSFTELEAWKESHKLVLQIYNIVKKFPVNEKFILSSQMLRAVISITSNIAEGFGRFSKKEKIHFYYTSQASLVELQNQLIIAKDISYIGSDEFNLLWEQTVKAHKLITGLIRSIKG